MIELTWIYTTANDLVWWRSSTENIKYCITRFDNHKIRNSVDIYIEDTRVAHVDGDLVQNTQKAKDYCNQDCLARLMS